MGFELPRLSRCCFCFSLRTGSLIIGYVSIIASLLFVAATSYMTYMIAMFIKDNKNKPNPEHSPEDLDKVALGVYVSQAYYLLVFLYIFSINVVLVVGVHTERPKLLKSYFYSGCFWLGLELALVVVSVVFIGILASLPLLKWCLIHFFCLLVVRSTYLEMEERNKPPPYEMQNLYGPPRPIHLVP